MARNQPEFRLHCVVADYLRLQYPNLLWIHCPNGEARSAITGARLKRMGVRPGVPDILLWWMDLEKGPQSAAIELKASKGKQTETQISFEGAFLSSGARYSLCRSLDDVQLALCIWNVPKVNKNSI